MKVNETGDYDCFVRVLKYDPAGIFIVEDACDMIAISDWKPIIGVTLDRMVQIVRIVLDKRKTRPGYSVSDLLGFCEKHGARSMEMFETFEPACDTEPEWRPEDYPGVVSFMTNTVKASNGTPPSEMWRSLFDIFRFYFDNGVDMLALGELPWPDQWGMCGSGQSRRIVLIDPGVNSDFSKPNG